PPDRPRQGLRPRTAARRGRRWLRGDGRTPRDQGAAAPMTTTHRNTAASRNPTYDFGGHVAFVTGASSGMGLATARAFAEHGAAVALADIDEDALRAATDELAAAGHEVLAVVCDVSDEDQVAAAVEQTVARFGRLDMAF